MKKVLALLLCVLLAVGVVGCKPSNSKEKIGFILVGDESETYTRVHMEGIEKALKNNGFNSEEVLVYKKMVEETSACASAAKELISQGCTLIISNSYGHQDFMAEIAESFPDVSFVSMTGDYAAISGLSNFYNAFTNVYESRYVSGVVAGLKLKELIDNEKLTDFNYNGSNVKIGYVGAFAYAEVVSGYTAFYLGLKSVVPNVVMEVQYTDSWFDFDKEAAAAENLMSRGCVIIGQHADSEGAPSAIEKAMKEGKYLCYSVGYNTSMLNAAPTASLTSALNVWEVYYNELVKAWVNHTDIPQDWSEGYAKGAVAIGELGKSCAQGTAAVVQEIENKLANGTLKVFDISTFTVNGQHLTSTNVDMSYMDWSTMTPIYKGEVVNPIHDGYFDESSFRSAPYFALRIDGIIEMSSK